MIVGSVGSEYARAPRGSEGTAAVIIIEGVGLLFWGQKDETPRGMLYEGILFPSVCSIIPSQKSRYFI